MKKLFTILLVMFVSAAVTYGATAVVLKLTGKAEMKTAGTEKWSKCYEGTVLKENTIVKTGIKSKMVIIMDDGSKIVMNQNTTIVIKELTNTSRTFHQEKGRTRVNVKKLAGGQRFSFNTPTAVCSIRGTEFSVDVEGQESVLKVFEGLINVNNLNGSGNEVSVGVGQKLQMMENQALGDPIPLTQEEQGSSANESISKSESVQSVQTEVGMDMSREQVQAAAAEEKKLAEYQEGKSIIDAFGLRVRLEEYIVRPQPDQIKMVILNERDTRYDYFWWIATFNTTLPADLTLATKYAQWRGNEDITTPPYWLKSNEYYTGNTEDGLSYGVTDGRIITNSDNYTELIYDKYYFKTHIKDASGVIQITDVIKKEVLPGKDISVDSDLGVPMTDYKMYLFGSQVNSITSDPNGLYSDYFSDANKTAKLGRIEATLSANNGGYALKNASNELVYTEDYYIMNDDGKLATQDEIDAMFDFATFGFKKTELLKWNFELVMWHKDFKGVGKKIDIANEPKIFINAGLIDAK